LTGRELAERGGPAELPIVVRPELIVSRAEEMHAPRGWQEEGLEDTLSKVFVDSDIREIRSR